eukprot:TRINITY_DN767_c0_g1_i4.p1 TRINITY_DN767_c0_g1~~TRINITY_DN767_c0_g1_i4.p1  ORF type:complete len:86 (+),score=8.28 TRINITY_DN767_c0_g1_i4:112-369(+)
MLHKLYSLVEDIAPLFTFWVSIFYFAKSVFFCRLSVRWLSCAEQSNSKMNRVFRSQLGVVSLFVGATSRSSNKFGFCFYPRWCCG